MEQASVKEIALGLGFTELGRFAGIYRHLFGELPSESLRRKPRSMVAISAGTRPVLVKAGPRWEAS